MYIAKRLLNLIPVLLGITLLVFTFLHLIPGDPALVMVGERSTPEQVEAIREQLGLNKPLPIQYITFLSNLIHFNFGTSIISGVPIAEEIKIRWPATFELSVAALLIATLVGIPVGILAAVRKNTVWDNLTMSGSLLGVSLPVYWLGLLLIYLFAVNLNWLPPSGRLSIDTGLNFKPITGFYVLDALLQLDFKVLQDVLKHLVLPALTLSTISLAI
ncbi:MAG: ABC transporter permease, partial [Coleofasciculus sp. S288]|nr:ABC transporter permease [Coleofasciculus sp. S288]